ncbi:MAG TPA: helix-turn-helix transcriptional regulator [Vicinamibacterales bacterium]|nr:helix-turn-helix transcriptional regulator [Vicinamibacterales bacterium]
MAATSLPDDQGADVDRPSEAGEGWTPIVLFVVIAALMATDLTIEFYRGVSMALQTFELLIFASALAGIAFHWWKSVGERHRARYLDGELAVARAEAHRMTEDARRWNQEAQQSLEGLGAAIDRQFERWGLTPAEREVALLQLKGFRHKAIAELRHTSERTVRQQALAIYRKSGLNGRPDLAAFFLEDLLLPGAVRHLTDQHQTNER